MKIVCYAEPTENGLLLHYPSSSVKAELLHLWEGAKENYNGYLAVDLKKPYKSRSSEQNRMFWGMVQQIASETGNDMEDIEQALKVIEKKTYEHRILFLRSWNEWGEGNYVEPDLKYGHGFLDAIKTAIS